MAFGRGQTHRKWCEKKVEMKAQWEGRKNMWLRGNHSHHTMKKGEKQ